MSGILKVLNLLLGILAVVVCLATVGIILYASLHPNMGTNVSLTAATEAPADETPAEEQTAAPASPAESGIAAGHVHNYKETVDIQATCMSSGRMKFICECGDCYYKEIATVGHVTDDWETVTKATETKDGLRVKKCIYCDELIAQEIIPATGSGTGGNTDGHVHEYTAAVESEPTCTVAGIKKYTCSCGSFYRENISAIGHLAGDWVIIKEATTTETGLQQKICNVCYTLIDSRGIAKLPIPSATPLPSGATPTPTPTPTATPTATPHTHNFVYYEYKPATCVEKGIQTGNCFCGAEDIKPIDVNKDNHNFAITVVKPTATQKGYTQYVCTRCGYSYTE